MELQGWKALQTALCMLALAASLAFAASYTFHDDFTAYDAESTGAPNWETNSIAWRWGGGELRFVKAPGHSFCWLKRKQGFTRMEAEVALQLERRTSDSWCVAGLVLYRNAKNFWHLALVASPEKEGKKHYLELAENLEGQWLSQQALKQFGDENGAVNWRYGVTYRLKLTLTPQAITGTVLSPEGKVLWRQGYYFTNEAVNWGVPGLDASGFEGAFYDFKVQGSGEVQMPEEIRHEFPPVQVESLPELKRKGTGFFSVGEVEGKWWAFTPQGEGFYAIGTDHCRYTGHWCEKLGYAPYQRNNEAKYGDPEKWAKLATDRLKKWHFNLLGAGRGPHTLYKGLAHTDFPGFGSRFAGTDAICEKTTWTGFPNVFSPDWPRFCDMLAKEVCRPQREDPWLFGYFLDNELEWFGKEYKPWGLFDEAAKLPAENSAKQALVAFLQRKYPKVTDFCKAWGTEFSNWQAVAQAKKLTGKHAKTVERDKLEFVGEIADRYFKVACAAIRKYDPNHLILGCRFAGDAPEGAWQAAGKYCDIVSFNYYGRVDLETQKAPGIAEKWEHYHSLCKRPMMITEWSFPALDSGLPCTHGAGMRVDTQAQRAQCYEIYQKLIFSLPFMVGSDFFMWVDEPALGISSTFPENTNYGLVNEHDEPYQALVQTASKVNRYAYLMHSQKAPELAVSLEDGGKVTLKNSGGAARVPVKAWLDGKALEPQTVQVPAGGKASLDLPWPQSPGAHVLCVEANPEGALPEANTADNKAWAAWYVPGAKTSRELVVLCVNPTSTTFAGKTWAEATLPEGVPASGALFTETGRPVPCGVTSAGKVWFKAPAVGAHSVVALHWRPGASAAEGEKGLKVKLSGGNFSLDTGKLQVETHEGPGDVLESIALEGLQLGNFQGVVQVESNGFDWPHSDQVVRVEGSDGPAVYELTVTSRHEPEPGSAHPAAFELTYRFTFFAGEAKFLAEALSVKNLDSRPLDLRAVFLYLTSRIGGSLSGDVAGGAGVPNYYLPVATWEDPAVGATVGLYPLDERLKVNFWRDPDEGPEHGDARVEFEPPVTLKPGESVQVEGARAWVFGIRKAGLRAKDVAKLFASPLQVKVQLPAQQ